MFDFKNTTGKFNENYSGLDNLRISKNMNIDTELFSRVHMNNNILLFTKDNIDKKTQYLIDMIKYSKSSFIITDLNGELYKEYQEKYPDETNYLQFDYNSILKEHCNTINKIEEADYEKLFQYDFSALKNKKQIIFVKTFSAYSKNSDIKYKYLSALFDCLYENICLNKNGLHVTFILDNVINCFDYIFPLHKIEKIKKANENNISYIISMKDVGELSLSYHNIIEQCSFKIFLPFKDAKPIIFQKSKDKTVSFSRCKATILVQNKICYMDEV